MSSAREAIEVRRREAVRVYRAELATLVAHVEGLREWAEKMSDVDLVYAAGVSSPPRVGERPSHEALRPVLDAMRVQSRTIAEMNYALFVLLEEQVS